MKKSFTIVELVVVIVILGILSTIAISILLKVSESYVVNRETDRLLFESDLILNKLANLMRNRIKNSVIATECNLSNNGCKRGEVKDFESISLLSKENSYKYPVIEWLNKSPYAIRGEWNSSVNRVVPGSAEFVDLNDTVVIKNDEYNVSLPYSNFNIIRDIEENYYKRWGVSFKDVFEDNLSVIVFSGPGGRGDFNDINHSYGWYKTLSSSNKAQKVYAILNYSNNRAHIKTIDDDDNATVYESYYLVDTAMAIVPVQNEEGDFNLTLVRNYFPWKDQNYTEGNSSLLASHVTQFKFREKGGVLMLFICIQSNNIEIKDYNLTICKERIVF